MGVADDPLGTWIRTAIFLAETKTVRDVYREGLKKLPSSVLSELVDKGLYLRDIYHSLDFLLCMVPYRDVQYGPKGTGKRGFREFRKLVKLSWIAYHIYVAERLLQDWDSLKKELMEWYAKEGTKYSDEKGFEDFLKFLRNYLQTTIAELAVLYVLLYNERAVIPLGFMQHPVTLEPSGPRIGDLIDIATLTFIEVKSKAQGWRANEIVTLALTTRLPSAIAVPRYGVDLEKKRVLNDRIVVDLYEAHPIKKDRYRMETRESYLEAPVVEELKPILAHVKLLEENARDYLNNKSK